MHGTYQQYITVNADMMTCVLQTVTLKFLFFNTQNVSYLTS